MKQFFVSKTLPFWLFTISAILVLTISQLIQDGVFMDGMLYISVSKNLADGLGTFWEPHYSLTYYTVFREQPPLYFGLLAAFYKIFGTSMYVERLFCFVCFTFTLIYIHRIWKTLFSDDEQINKNSWLPILFFISIPISFWSYSNHVEETVMTLFTTMSVYYLSKVLFKKENVIFYLILAGVCVFLSSLTKGIQGLFPITAVFSYWMVSNKDISFKKNILYSLILVGTPVLIYSILIFFNNHIYDVFKLYFENRLGMTFNNKTRFTTDNRFEIMFRLFTELIPMFILMLFIYLFSKKHKVVTLNKNAHFTKITWLLLIGFSGSMPLMITLEQRGFYLLTTLPFFTMAGAAFLANRMGVLVEKINLAGNFYKYAKWITIILFLFSLTFTISKIGETKRDKKLLSDIYNIGKIIPHGNIVGIPPEMGQDNSLREYLIRNFYISSDDGNTQYEYFIIRKNLSNNLVPKSYLLYPLETKEIDLYKLAR
ncbi:MAG: glycosyltransferase family 39 protein [Bacteroidia bacterium]|nr:glycosyltransferase family 39 protein [Bacteroidia bacterium]